MLRVLKYGTGQEIPKGAKYLSTQVEKIICTETRCFGSVESQEQNFRVWHYFLVECDKDGNPPATREFPSHE